MKHLIYILLLFLASITACQRRTAYPPAMQQAEALMNTRPDSALTLLQGMADTLAMLPEEARMYHQLLTIQAKDKLYITHTSDSLINRIVDFYENYDNNDRLMMAYFYQGSTYRDMNDAPRALKAFQQAVDLNVPNLDLLAKTYNQMGTLFMYQGLHDEVIRVNRKAIEAYLALGKKNRISYFQRDIARMHHLKEQKDSALHYYKTACHTALDGKDSIKYHDILGELGTFYYQTDSFPQAKKALFTALSHGRKNRRAHLYPYIGYIYEKEQNLDSAFYYQQKALEHGNMRQKYYAYQNLFNLSNAKGHSAKANEYIQKAMTLKDTLDKIQQSEVIAQINALYNYQHTEKENHTLKLNQVQQKEWLSRLTALSLLLLVVCSACILYIKKKGREKEVLKQRLIQITQEIHNQSPDAIENNIQEIARLNDKQKETQEKGFALESQLLEIQKERLSIKNQDILHLQAEQKLREQILKDSSIYKHFYWAASDPNTKITHEDWVNLQKEIDKAYPNFTKKLYDLNASFSIHGIQICCLIKIAMPSAAIARILGRSRGAITLACRRYYEKIHQSDGSAEMFRTFISQL